MENNGPDGFKERLDRYLKDVNSANSEAARSYYFLEFIRNLFGGINADYLERLHPEMEKYLVKRGETLLIRGRIDALLGNLIIEFKVELNERRIETAESEIRKYASILWSRDGESRVPYMTMITDGVKFLIYRPRAPVIAGTIEPIDVILDPVDRIDLGVAASRQAFFWLDRYMLSKSLQPVSSQAFSKEFSVNGSAFRDSSTFLLEGWRESHEQILYEQWASFLRIVYGSDVESEGLFIRHTYLATLAKLLSYSVLSGGALPVSPDQVSEILEGKIFEKWNVQNFLEEDFFSWVGRSESGIKASILLLERLSAYDLGTIDEDVLKALYQDLVDPSARHDLGEYYTPDWLAELMIENGMKDNASISVLDPSCGSGTFLASAIRWKKKLLNGKKPNEKLGIIIKTVSGIDVHPLAVIIARTNFLTSLGTDLLSTRSGPISIPIYLADTIRPPQVDSELYEHVGSYRLQADGEILRIPSEISSDPELNDNVVEGIKEYSRTLAEGVKSDPVTFRNLMERKLGDRKIEDGTLNLLFETSEMMAKLIQNKRDTIWPFILKNLYKPLFLQSRKFDLIVGNPPWLSYRYIENMEYQRFIKDSILNVHRLLPQKKAELMTQMELATLFFARVSELYLSKKGKISFVMPRSVFVSDQHDVFRKCNFVPEMKILEIIDLEDVKPLFNVPTCVITATRGFNKYPVRARTFEGTLTDRNSKLPEAMKLLKHKNERYQYYEIGQRSFIHNVKYDRILKSMAGGKRSYYYDKFTQGATIVPRFLWFVEPVVHPKLGLDPTAPMLSSSQRSMELAKDDYKGLKAEGNVESRYIYNVVTGSELLPFCVIELPVAVLPIEPEGSNYRIIQSQEAKERGDRGLAAWLSYAEKIWDSKRGEKAGNMTIYSRLNYHNTLTDQNPRSKYRVLYNTSGTYLVSSVVRNQQETLMINSAEIHKSGVIADSTTYRSDTDNLQEAIYLSSFFNSRVIDELIKPMQSRGLFGERHIHKKVLELPIPKFDPKNKLHRKLIEIGEVAREKSEKLISGIENNKVSVGKLRNMVKNEISEELSIIDSIVNEIMEGNASITGKLDEG